MRGLVVVLMSILVANALPGPGVGRAGGPAPTTSTYCVTQGSLQYNVHPVERATNVVTWYDYYSASAHDPFVEAYASILYLYTDTTTGRLHLVFHFNIDGTGTPDAETSVSLAGIPSGAVAEESDDAGEFSLAQSPQGQFHYFFNTDGGVLGPLPTASDWQLSVTMSHFGADPMRSQKWVDGDTTRLTLAMTGTIRISTTPCNRAPTASAGGPYTGFEGSPITFNASGSSDPDGDSLIYTWDWTSDGVNDVTTASPMADHTYPDDFVGSAKVTVSDGTLSNSASALVTVRNVAPTLTLDALRVPGTEGTGPVAVSFRATDPGTDLVTVTVDWGDGLGPHVGASTFLGPGAVSWINFSHTYGDNGAFAISIVGTDDDGGVGILSGLVGVVDNEAPTALILAYPLVANEGDMVTFIARAMDNGSDDLSFSIDYGNGATDSTTVYNDGVGPDPQESPLGTFPFTADAAFDTRFPQNGNFFGHVAVRDDDGGERSLDFSIEIDNVAPAIIPFRPGSAVEGAPGSITATATDPGDDALTFVWEFELGPTFTETLPGTGSPTTAPSTAPFLYGDNGAYAVRLTVTDQDGASATFETTIEVANAAPTVQITKVQRPAAFVLRVAGEKWHDVTAAFFANDTAIGSLAVIRVPGSPDDQAVSTGDLELSLAFRYTAKLRYTPADDPVNGQPNGANPVWVIVRAPDGTEVRLHHTFNVEHPGTYEWDVDLTPYVAQVAIRFSAIGGDAGSDDLSFAWDLGDGGAVETFVAFNDGVGPDPAKSPGGVFPFTATSELAHAFPGAGVYVITVRIFDDDGGVGTASTTITILG